MNEDAVEQVLATAGGSRFDNDETGETLIVLENSPCVILADREGNTFSAYLSTVSPEVIAATMDGGDAGDYGGWTTGWDA